MSDWSIEDKQKVKDLFNDFKQKGKPIYPYIKRREIYFRIVYNNKFFVGYRDYESAEKVYMDLKDEKIDMEEVDHAPADSEKRRITIEDGFNKIMEAHRLAYEAGELKHSSYTKKESDFRLHILPYFKDKPLVKITKADIADFVEQIRYRETSGKKLKNGEEKKISVSLQTEILMYFKMVYKETKRRFDLETSIDIDEEIKMPKLKKTRKEYSKSVEDILNDDYDAKLKSTLESVVKVEKGIFNPVFAICLITNCTGMRIDEVTALKPSKYDCEKKLLLIDRSISWHPNKSNTDSSYEETSTKTDSERIIPLAESLAAYLEAYIGNLKELLYYSKDMYIFSRLDYALRSDSMFDPFSLKTYTNHLRTAKASAEKKDESEVTLIKNHIARHAFNSRLKDNGIEQYDRESYLGHSHSSGANTLYTHGSRFQEEKIVEISEKLCRYLTKDISEFIELTDMKITENE